MSPFVSPWTLSLPDRRWLGLVILPAVAMLGMTISAPRPASHPQVQPPANVDLRARLDLLARAHREWVADHGAGCARALWHIVDYTDVTDLADSWGMPLVLTCDRFHRGSSEHIDVRVSSSGPDLVRDTADDLISRDVQIIAR